MRKAIYSDKNQVISILTEAFLDNKSVNYLIPQDDRRVERIKHLMDYSFEVCYASGKILLSENKQCCALISFPDNKKTSLKSIVNEIRLIVKSIGILNVSKAINREKKISINYPKTPIYYLWFIGVHPSAQNKGMGGMMMDTIVKDAISMNRTIYLETSTEKNVSWYQKFGFTIYNELDFGYLLKLLKK